jgi:hypothetical protein
MQCISFLNIYIDLHKKLNLKMLTCFGMIWNCDNFSRQNTKFGKIYTFSKNYIYSKLNVKNIWHIGETINKINKKFQNISFEIISLWTQVFLTKRPQKRQ